MADFDNTPPETLPIQSVPWADCLCITSASDPTTLQDNDTVDGETVEDGDRVLKLGAHATAGIYTIGSSSSARSTDANAAAEMVSGRLVRVTGGATPGIYRLATAGAITLGSTSLTFSKVEAGSLTPAAAAAFDNTAAASITI